MASICTSIAMIQILASFSVLARNTLEAQNWIVHEKVGQKLNNQ